MTLECEKCHYRHTEADTATAFCPNCGAPYAVLQPQTADSGEYAPSLYGLTGAQRPDISENNAGSGASGEMYHFSPQAARNSDIMLTNHQNKLKHPSAVPPTRNEPRSLFTKLNLLIAIGILVLSAALGSGLYLLQHTAGTSNNTLPQSIATTTPSPKLLEYSAAGFTTKYPASWQINTATISIDGVSYVATYFQDPTYSRINYILLSGGSSLGISAVPTLVQYFGCKNYVQTTAQYSALINGKIWSRMSGSCAFASNSAGLADTAFITTGSKSYLAIFLAPKLFVSKTFRNYESLILHTLTIATL